MISFKTYIKAASLEDAIALAVENPGNFRYLAGGTDVIVNKFQGNDSAEVLIDITAIPGLKDVNVTDDELKIGALLTLDELMKQDYLIRHLPVLVQAIHSVASPTIRKTATIGGNLLCENRCSFYNQSEWWRESAGYCLKCKGDTCLASGGTKNCFSKFSSDTAVVLISLGAVLDIRDEKGDAMIPLEGIYSGDGVHPRSLRNTALIKSIRIPLMKGSRAVYLKLRKRETLDFTSLTTAVTVNNSGNIRIVLGGVHAKPVVIEGLTADDMNMLISQAITGTRIVDNDTYSRKYRKEMISIFLKRSFMELNLILNTKG